MSQTHSKQRDRRRVSEARQQRDIAIYESHMRGNSVRAIQGDFEIKSTQTVHVAISRGRDLVVERGIDIEERRIEIDQLFRNTLGALAEEIQEQRIHGRITQTKRDDGFSEVKRVKGVDPRTAEALARSADRWAQFLGITDRAAEVTQATTLINLAPPMDGNSFTEQWAQTVETTACGQKSGQDKALPASEPSAVLEGATDQVAVDAA